MSCKRTPTTSQDLEDCAWKAAIKSVETFTLSPSALNIQCSAFQPLWLLTPPSPQLWEFLEGENSPSTFPTTHWLFPPPRAADPSTALWGISSVPAAHVLGFMLCVSRASQMRRKKYLCRKPQIRIVMI